MTSEYPTDNSVNAIQANSNQQIKGIIFDFDGVLSSFQARIGDPIAHAALMIKKDITKELMTEISLEMFEYLTTIEQHPSITTLAKFAFSVGRRLGMTTFQAIKFVATSAIIFMKNRKQIVPRTGVRRVLRELLAEDYKLILLTNSNDSIIEAALEKIPEIKEFDLVLTRDDTKTIKPNAKGFFQAMEILGLDPDEIISVGDQASDLIASKKAGIKTIAIFDQGMEFTKPHLLEEEPNFIIQDFIQIPNLLVFLRDSIIEDLRATIDLTEKTLQEYITENNIGTTPGP